MTITLKCLSSCLVVVFAQSIEARCWVNNEDVVGAAPTGSNYIWVLQLHLSEQQFYCLLRCDYIRGFTVGAWESQLLTHDTHLNNSSFWGIWVNTKFHDSIPNDNSITNSKFTYISLRHSYMQTVVLARKMICAMWSFVVNLKNNP